VCPKTGVHDLNHKLPIGRLLEASKNPELLRTMQRFYAEVDADIARRPGVCLQSGVCCQFDARDGHCLFVTALEVCYYLAVAAPPPPDGNRCPHVVDGLCGVRDGRPLGCRVFYCDPAAQAWQGPVTEVHLARLKGLHDEFRIPYFYADWLRVLEALRAYGLTQDYAQSGCDASVRSLPIRP